MRKGLLLLTLGSPEAPTPAAVRRFLSQFLMDPFVIHQPAWLRFILVNGLIVPSRSRRVAKLYHKIWTESGSPLLAITDRFATAVQLELGDKYDVRWAVRYGEPSVSSRIRNWDVDEIYMVPLYPQYAESSTRTVIEHALDEIWKTKPGARVSILRDFFGEREFVDAQARLIKREIESFKPDHLVLSYHGLPIHHLTKVHPQACQGGGACCASVTAANRFCYRAQCEATSRELIARLPFAPEKTHVAYQSRLGRRPWIQPFTDKLVTELAAAGAKRLLVSCPSFVADCLETLDEVGFRLRDQFLTEGGEDLRLVPALNSEPDWVKAFTKMISRPEIYAVSNL